MRSLPSIPRVIVISLALLAFAPLRGANEPRPVVGPGATKDDVIKAYGWPNGQSQSGTKEILSYAQGDVTLENGRVERVNFSPDIPWQAPKPRPGPATASTRKAPEQPVDFWTESYDTALAEAQKRNARVLVLFTGSDWSPASRQFHEEVEHNPEFVNAFAGDFVFLRLDYPRGSPVPAVISDEKLRLRDRYSVTTYPTLLVLSPSGELLARADLSTSGNGRSFRDRAIAAVRDARQVSAGRVPLAGPVVNGSGAPASAQSSAGKAGPVDAEPTAPAMMKAGKAIFIALVSGAVLVAFVLWKMWRQPRSRPGGPSLEIADRIDSAAGGMPLTAEMSGWSKAKLRAVVAKLAEYDDYAVVMRPSAQDIDLELRKGGDVKPRVLVCCAAGNEGVISTKRLRELFGSLAAEGVENGWFVSPAGFSADGRAYAASHRIILVGSEGLHSLMREVPPVSLPGVLAAE